MVAGSRRAVAYYGGPTLNASPGKASGPDRCFALGQEEKPPESPDPGVSAFPLALTAKGFHPCRNPAFPSCRSLEVRWVC